MRDGYRAGGLMRSGKTIILKDGDREIAFCIRRMPALHLESWLARAAEIMPPEKVLPALSSPIALATLVLQRGLLALACGENATALLEELLCCCAVIDTETGVETPCSSQDIHGCIRDVSTLLCLRKAALQTNLSFAFDGTRKPLTLPQETAFRLAYTEQARAKTVNVPQVTASLIAQGIASLNDLRTIYTYDDALDLLEILNVRNYNQWAALEAAKHRRR